MNNKYFQRIIAFAAVILFAMPLSLKAQTTEIETRYENAATFSNEELAQMLAPIALYPDALLSQMLIAASYPFEIVEADRWLARNPQLRDEALDDALSQKDWDVSVLSLCHYPKVLTMMSENLNWTARLGDAFVNQQQDVMDTVQELRARASAQGALANTDEQKVIVEERIIRIEPAYYNYMYVPVYDPLIIYGPWWFPAFVPFRIFYPGVAVVGPRIVFAPRLFIGFGVIGWSAFDWRARNVVIVNIDRTRRFNRHVNVYRGPDHSPWRPDRERRFVREQRAKEIPRFHPTVKSPREVPPGGFKRSPNVVVPPRSKPGPAGPRVIDKDKRPEAPKVIDRDKRPDISGPRVIDKGQPQPQFKPQPKLNTEQPQPAKLRPQPAVKPQPQPAVKPQPQPAKPRPQPCRGISATNTRQGQTETRPQPAVKPQAQPVKPQPQPVQPQSRPEKKGNIVDDKSAGRQMRDTNGYAPRSGIDDRNNRGGGR